ncbi:MAG: hypothetical protein RLZZ546_2496, partial [Bacteroidota bacterium]
PEPHAEFTRIFNRGMPPGREVQSLDGNVNELLSGNPREGNSSPTGQGFAMGLTLLLKTGDIELFPFFFNLTAVLGCDINVTKASPEADRRCAGTDRVPGTDGWYATGQFYAGIEGAFGIKINLFIAEIKVSILEASAAIILRGGLPNPEWVSGRGSFYYNVCNGLAEGNCNFNFEAGTVCIPVTGNPFGGVTLIQDIEPEDGATNVSVYSEVSAAFSMDMNKTYEFQEYISAVDPPVIRRMQPYMHSFELRKQGTSVNLVGNGVWSEENHIYTFEPTNVLAANSRHTLRVEARIRENGRDLLVAGRTFKEEKTHTFTTGQEPDKIVDENLRFTYPYINQQTFFKEETRFNQGYIKARRADNRCFQVGDVSSFTREFSARFTDEDGNVTNVPAIIYASASGISFDVSKLLPSKIYCVQIIRKDTPINQNSTSGNPYMNIAYANRHLINPINTSLQISNLIATIGNSTITSNQYKRINLPNGKVGQNETEIYSYFFRTSKYTTFGNKMRAEPTEWQGEIITFGLEIGRAKKSMIENFEWVDFQSFKVVPQSDHTFEKRVKFIMQKPPDMLDGVVSNTAIPVNQYLNNDVSQKITVPYISLLLARNRVVDNLNSRFPPNAGFLLIPEVSYSIDYIEFNKNVYINPESRHFAPLSQDAINNAFTEVYNGNSPLSRALANRISNIDIAFNPLLLANLPVINTTTIINYEPTIAALNSYKQLRRSILNFTNLRINILRYNFDIFNSELNIWNELTPTEKSYFNQHILRNGAVQQMQYVNFTRGPQTIGLRYLYPDSNGTDVNGSLFPLTFRL